jgi:hypothetical protein
MTKLKIILYAFFWVIPWRLNFLYRRFGTLCLSHLHRQVGVEWLGLRNVGVFIREIVGSTLSPSSYWLRLFSSQPFPVWIPKHFSNLVILHLPAYENGTECFETSVYKIQTPGNYPEENIQHLEHGEGLKLKRALPAAIPLSRESGSRFDMLQLILGFYLPCVIMLEMFCISSQTHITCKEHVLHCTLRFSMPRESTGSDQPLL